MNKENALAFLRRHQPMPPDNKLTEELINQYDEVRKYFIEHPDPSSILPFLLSFGDGDGFGVYQLVEDVMRQFSSQEVVPQLQIALRSKIPSVRYWSTQIATNFPASELIAPLQDLLLDRSQTSDTRFFAAVALEQINDKHVDDILRQALKQESDSAVRTQISEALQNRRSENV